MDSRADGFRVGSEWAKDSAESCELQRIGELRSDEDCWDATLTTSEASVYTAAESLFFMIQPESEGDRLASSEFWEFVLGDDTTDANNDDDLVRGFAEGAYAVWLTLPMSCSR